MGLFVAASSTKDKRMLMNKASTPRWIHCSGVNIVLRKDVLFKKFQNLLLTLELLSNFLLPKNHGNTSLFCSSIAAVISASILLYSVFLLSSISSTFHQIFFSSTIFDNILVFLFPIMCARVAQCRSSRVKRKLRLVWGIGSFCFPTVWIPTLTFYFYLKQTMQKISRGKICNNNLVGANDHWRWCVWKKW